MKALKSLSLLFAALLIFVTSVNAQGISPDDPVVKAKYTTIESNLIEGLKSDNEGLKISCAYYLGELKSEKAVNPLMAILRCDDCYGARIVSALSLIKIDNPQGVYMVKRTAEFNDSENVRKMSEKFYLAYLWQKYLEEHPDKVDELAFVKF